jgi:hypothetical protein
MAKATSRLQETDDTEGVMLPDAAARADEGHDTSGSGVA